MWIWVLLFLASSLLWSWILFLGGAERLEGSIIAMLLIHSRAINWTVEGIKLFAACSWFINGIWFIVGLCYPSSRLLSYLM